MRLAARGTDLGGWMLRAIVVALAVCALQLSATPATAAEFTWSGAAPMGTENWSDPSNWEGSTPSGIVERLTFPALTSAACTASPATATCYHSDDDVGGLSVNALAIDDGVGYFINGVPLTLGAGGITAQTTNTSGVEPAFLSPPITLGAAQTWSVAGTGVIAPPNPYAGIALSSLTGASSALSIQLSDLGLVQFDTDAEVGPVTVVGVGTGDPGIVSLAPTGGSLNDTDGNPISISGGAGLVASGGASGPLTMDAGQLQVSPGHAFTVDGSVSLTDTQLQISIGRGTVAGTDYSELVATGPVHLANVRLQGIPSDACPTPGTRYTLITTPALSGTFAGVPNGATVTLEAPVPCAQPILKAEIRYEAHALTATIASSVPPPEFGRTVDVKIISGIVRIKLPGVATYVPLTGAQALPVGAIIDTTHGTVQLTSAAEPGRSATQSGEFHSGMFRVSQITTRSPLARGRRVGITVLKLLGRLPRNCTSSRSAHSARAAGYKRPTVRRLWGHAKGRFQTVGHYGSAGVREPEWLTEDRCTGTFFHVAQGAVVVDDFPHHRTFLLRAGQSFLVHPGPGG